MGLVSAIIVGFIVFVLVQYLVPGISMLVAIFIAGFIAGMLAEGILKGLFVGIVISVIGVLIIMFFYGGFSVSGTNTSDIIGSLLGILGAGVVIISSIAGLAGSALRRYKFRK